jgi:hypothetical protein
MVYAILDSGIFIAQTFPEPYSLQAIKLFNDSQDRFSMIKWVANYKTE